MKPLCAAFDAEVRPEILGLFVCFFFFLPTFLPSIRVSLSFNTIWDDVIMTGMPSRER